MSWFEVVSLLCLSFLVGYTTVYIHIDTQRFLEKKDV